MKKTTPCVLLIKDLSTLVLEFLELKDKMSLKRVCRDLNKFTEAWHLWEETHLPKDMPQAAFSRFVSLRGQHIRLLSAACQIPFQAFAQHPFQDVLPKLSVLDLSHCYDVSAESLGLLPPTLELKHKSVLVSFQRLLKWMKRQRHVMMQESIVVTLKPHRRDVSDIWQSRWTHALGFQHFIRDMGLPSSSKFLLDLFVIESQQPVERPHRVEIRWIVNRTQLLDGSLICIR